MRILSLLLLLTLAYSCQQAALEPPQAGTIDKKGLLWKVDITAMPQNQVFVEYVYEYDDSGRVSRIITSTLRNGVVYTSTSRFTRDALGRATSILFAPDTAATRVSFTYQGASRRLSYALLFKEAGSTKILLDSMVYSYNNLDQLTKTEQYILQSNGQLKKHTYQEYTYDTKGNVLSKQLYQHDNSSGIFVASLKYTWEYDNKMNPRYFNDMAMVYWGNHWPTSCSPNNVTRHLNTYPANSGPDDELSYMIQYNAENKPVAETQNPGATSITRYYYYP